MIILAIDTSCDETSVSVLENDRVLANVITSQISFHKLYGGVKPSVAKNKHKENIDKCINKAVRRTIKDFNNIDIIAVTYGPGLAIALEVGILKAKELSRLYNKKIVIVNHLEAHILSILLRNKKNKRYIEGIQFPFISCIVSGGHTQLVLVKEIGEYCLLGHTIDDAAGEAFDKVARLLKLGYPGGPVISELSKHGNTKAYHFPRPLSQKNNYNFSFSGLKTAVLFTLKKVYLKKYPHFNEDEISFSPHAPYYKTNNVYLSKSELSDFLASFEEAVVDSIIIKCKKALKDNNVTCIALVGGVAANNRLRRRLRQAGKKLGVSVIIPPHKFCTDNAAMVGIVGYYKAKAGDIVQNNDLIDRNPVLNL